MCGLFGALGYPAINSEAVLRALEGRGPDDRCVRQHIRAHVRVCVRAYMRMSCERIDIDYAGVLGSLQLFQGTRVHLPTYVLTYILT